MDDLRLLYRSAGHQLKPTVFLFTESEIKDEVFLELVNSILMTGEVPGLFAKVSHRMHTLVVNVRYVLRVPDKEDQLRKSESQSAALWADAGAGGTCRFRRRLYDLPLPVLVLGRC